MDLLTIEIEDKFTWGLEKLTKYVASTLEDECHLRGWAPDYKLGSLPSVKTLLGRNECMMTLVHY